MIKATAEVNPLSTGFEMKFIKKPSRKTPSEIE